MRIEIMIMRKYKIFEYILLLFGSKKIYHINRKLMMLTDYIIEYQIYSTGYEKMKNIIKYSDIPRKLLLQTLHNTNFQNDEIYNMILCKKQYLLKYYYIRAFELFENSFIFKNYNEHIISESIKLGLLFDTYIRLNDTFDISDIANSLKEIRLSKSEIIKTFDIHFDENYTKEKEIIVNILNSL
jgi:hypothetical protein